MNNFAAVSWKLQLRGLQTQMYETMNTSPWLVGHLVNLGNARCVSQRQKLPLVCYMIFESIALCLQHSLEYALNARAPQGLPGRCIHALHAAHSISERSVEC
jgi:hypothetical protein